VYTTYPTASDTAPSNVLDALGTNNANFFDPTLGFTDPVNFLTPVGTFIDSASAWGTWDQGGDVFDWNESLIDGGRGIRGGAYHLDSSYLQSGSRLSDQPSYVGLDIGFRVAAVPEPSSVGLLFLAAVGLLRRRREPTTGDCTALCLNKVPADHVC
jgi:hypothetical protein